MTDFATAAAEGARAIFRACVRGIVALAARSIGTLGFLTVLGLFVRARRRSRAAFSLAFASATSLRAFFADFFVALAVLRAILSRAFASRACCLAASARAPACAAAASKRRSVEMGLPDIGLEHRPGVR